MLKYTWVPAGVAPVAVHPAVSPAAVDFAGEWGVAIAVVAIAIGFAAALAVTALRRRAR